MLKTKTQQNRHDSVSLSNAFDKKTREGGEHKHKQQIKVGEIYPGGCPAEGPVAQIRGGAFNVTIFQPNLTATHIKLFKKRPLQTGVYIHESVAGPMPFFIVKWRGPDWYFDVPLNLTGEQEGNIIVLILCDYPSGRVRAMRAINIELETMRRIKEACEQQTTTRAINVAIDECYAKVPLEHKIDEAIIQ